MEKNTHSLNWLALGADLIDCLRSKGNHRLTRYDAFVWMMEHIQKGVAVRDADGVVVNSAPYSASYKRLAEDWNWERHTVQSFIEELTALSVITSKRQGNVYVFSSARSLTNSSSYDFTFPIIHLRTITKQQSNVFFKISASLLAAIQKRLASTTR